MSFNPADYASVDERLPLFWKDCPRGRIVTELVVDDGTRIVMKAELYAEITDAVPTTSGFAEEVRGSSMVNKTSALENCETSAVGRTSKLSVSGRQETGVIGGGCQGLPPRWGTVRIGPDNIHQQ